MNITKTFLAGLAGASLCMADISGTVTDTSGAPINGAAVSLELGGQTATTGADGSFTLTGLTHIDRRINQSLPHNLSATVHNGVLWISGAERSDVVITALDLNGKAFSTVQRTSDAGVLSLSLPHGGAGVYFYKVKSGANEVVLKVNSIGAASQGTAASIHGSSSPDALAKQALSPAAINDVITVTKTGYLNYRVCVTNPDTSGIGIKMMLSAGTVTDADGNVYQSVKIGTQVWTVENLRTTKYNDGSSIPPVPDSAAWFALTTPGYCYYGNTTSADSIKRFGALYNWYVVGTGKLAPSGWHVPTDADWDTLQYYLVTNGYNGDGTTDTAAYNRIGKALAAKADWAVDRALGAIGNNLTKNNASGFSALPGGGRNDCGGACFGGAAVISFWWSATQHWTTTGNFRELACNSDHLVTDYAGKNSGFAVRLVKDN